MEAQFDTWWFQITSKSLPMGNIHGCLQWQGAITSGGYGQKRVTLPDGKNKTMLLSRVIYMCKHRTISIPKSLENGEKLEMSHLCHNKLCIRKDHLFLETHEMNMERQHCHHQNLCTGAHHPHCLL